MGGRASGDVQVGFSNAYNVCGIGGPFINVDAAHDAFSLIEGRTRDDLRASRLLVSALTRQIEIVGEAAGRISPECRVGVPGIH